MYMCERLKYCHFDVQQGIDISKDTMALQRIREAAEKAKIELSASTQVRMQWMVLIVMSNSSRLTPHRLISTFLSLQWTPVGQSI